MTHKPYRISLTVKVGAPFLTQSSEPGAFGLDMAVARDDDGIPIIPGTLLAGKLKDAWSQFEPALIDTWLGKESSSFKPAPGRLCDADLRIVRDAAEPLRTPYSRNKIDGDAGAGAPGALFFLEQPWAAGETLTFEGAWHAIGSEKEMRVLCNAIRGGLLWMAQLGSERSIGFGRVKDVCVSFEPAPSVNNCLPDITADRIYFALTFTEPLCLPQTSTDNLFVGGDIIPGNALKAAFALTWGAQEGKWNQPIGKEFSTQHQALEEKFSNIVFSHAFPAGDGKASSNNRPSPLPQSLVQADDKFYDAALLDKPHIIKGTAPAFQTDWKGRHYEEAGKKQAWGETRRALRVRTAIEAGRRISAEGQLFAYETVSAEKYTRWLGWADFSCITDAEQRKAAMQSFLDVTQAGLHYVGKTKAVGVLSIMEQQQAVWPSAVEAKDGVWVVMLNTPALLTPITGFNEASGKKELKAAYEKYWKEVSGDTLELSHYFARQRLAGGEYAHKRRGVGKPYKPWLLTEAGSVFVLKAKNSEAAKKIEEWLKTGMPLSDAVKDEYTDNWQRNPYLPQNGYGEISVNIRHTFEILKPSDKTKLTLVNELIVEEANA